MNILYTNHCPRCLILENKLKEKHIPYITVTDESQMLELGFSTVPVLAVDKTMYNFKQAIHWVDEQ